MSYKALKLTGLLIFLVIIFQFIPRNSIRESAAMLAGPISTTSEIAILSTSEPIVPSIPVNPDIPVRLKIPKINIDAAIESVGLTPQGAVGVPKGSVNTAWYNLGPRPGENGSAVITGHYGIWKNGTPTVFNNLSRLRPGDKIYVRDRKGITFTFIVREIRKYDPNANASDVFVSSDGKAHLNLITCSGFWSKVSKNYSKRLVIFTDKE
jgi:LPXTG-site transpeptidase (sortase) family protein